MVDRPRHREVPRVATADLRTDGSVRPTGAAAAAGGESFGDDRFAGAAFVRGCRGLHLRRRGERDRRLLRHLPHLRQERRQDADRKSTRLNSSHGYISYAVFCLKKKKKT